MSTQTEIRLPDRSTDDSVDPPATTPVRRRATADPVRAFFALAFAYSWACWIPAALFLDGAAREGLLFLGVWGPAAAAVTVTRLRGESVRHWFRSLLVWRVARRWYAFALGLPIAMVTVVSVPFLLLGHDLDGSLLGPRLAVYLPMLVVLSLVGGGSEELGWRGFALPALLERHHPVRATLVLGALWALWHLPLLGAADDLTHGLDGGPLALVLTATVVNIVALAFLYTVLYRHTRSALLAVLLHGGINAANGTLVLREEIEGSAYATLQFCVTATTLVIAGLLLWWTRGRLGPRDTDRPDPTVRLAERVRGGLDPVWQRTGLRLSVALGAAGAWGLAAGLWTPRGPLTSAEALWAMVFSVVVGAAAGLALRSRWAMVTAPMAFAVVFEMVRAGVDGPMVDGIHISTYGMIAFATGRGFHALVSLVPMVLGAAIGAGIARSLTPSLTSAATPRRSGRGRRTVAIVTGLGLVLLGLAIARPARTAPIVDADGNEVAGSVAELTTLDVNGHDLHLMIRGRDVDNPVLLFLAGGPGGSEMGAMRRHLPELEDHFTVVTWDQRGSGRSYPELDPTDTFTLDGFVDDTVVVTDHLRERFGQDRIYVLGQSWGTTLGVLAVQAHPERYHAFVGSGQMVSQRETDRIFYEDTLAWARETGNDGLVDELVEAGPPPYDAMFPYEAALTHEQDVYPYDHSGNSEGPAQMGENLFVEEYTLIDQVHVVGAFTDVFAALYPQLQGIDFRETATEFDVPVFFVQGAHEAGGRAELFEQWYPMIEAPAKGLAVLDTSGHRPLWEQPDEFVDYMVDTVLAETAAR